MPKLLQLLLEDEATGLLVRGKVIELTGQPISLMVTKYPEQFDYFKVTVTALLTGDTLTTQEDDLPSADRLMELAETLYQTM